MKRSMLDNVIPSHDRIEAVVGFRLSEDGPYIIIAIFLSLGDAQLFVSTARPKLGIGSYLAIPIDDD
jgi:hypothetical protein